jgi:hypothetical protein
VTDLLPGGTPLTRNKRDRNSATCRHRAPRLLDSPGAAWRCSTTAPAYPATLPIVGSETCSEVVSSRVTLKHG